MNNNFGLSANLRVAVHHSVDACLMNTSEGFSFISHLEDGWNCKSLMILIFFIHTLLLFTFLDMLKHSDEH